PTGGLGGRGAGTVTTGTGGAGTVTTGTVGTDGTVTPTCGTLGAGGSDSAELAGNGPARNPSITASPADAGRLARPTFAIICGATPNYEMRFLAGPLPGLRQFNPDRAGASGARSLHGREPPRSRDGVVRSARPPGRRLCWPSRRPRRVRPVRFS